MGSVVYVEALGLDQKYNFTTTTTRTRGSDHAGPYDIKIIIFMSYRSINPVISVR